MISHHRPLCFTVCFSHISPWPFKYMNQIMSPLWPNPLLNTRLSENKIQSPSHGQQGPKCSYTQIPFWPNVSPLRSWITLFQPQWPSCYALITAPPSISQPMGFLFSQSGMLYPQIFSRPGYSLHPSGCKKWELSPG